MEETQTKGGQGLQPHEIRVVEERLELVEKITKLHKFMSSDFYTTLGTSTQTYFVRQEKVMKEYADILLDRINAFEGTIENTTIEPTFGQLAVGYKFNPSNQSNVDNAKKLMADAIDLLEKEHKEITNNGSAISSWSRNVFKTAAFNAIITAQMALVKYLTWKD